MLLSGISEDALQPMGFPGWDVPGLFCQVSASLTEPHVAAERVAPRRFRCGTAERESRSFLMLLIQTCDPCTLWGKVPHTEKAALGFSRCHCFPQCPEPLCTCAQVPVLWLPTWGGFTVCFPQAKESGISEQGILLKSYLQALVLIPRTVPI